MLTIHFFAGLKRFFPGAKTLKINEGSTPYDVIAQLKEEMPEAHDLLSKCRVAFEDEFISLGTLLKGDEHIYLIPPSSGG